MTATAKQQSEREIGIVKFYDPERAYGFLIGPDGADIFFHISAVAGGYELQKNERVEIHQRDRPLGALPRGEHSGKGYLK
jgi:cold shock CspA family protein